MSSVTRWLDYFFNIWQFTAMPNLPNNKNISQIGFKSLPITEWIRKRLQKISENYQIGEISPNLVTLMCLNGARIMKFDLHLIQVLSATIWLIAHSYNTPATKYYEIDSVGENYLELKRRRNRWGEKRPFPKPNDFPQCHKIISHCCCRSQVTVLWSYKVV